MRSLYQRFKEMLPGPIRRVLSAVNQRWFARTTLQKKYGDWFEVDWRRKFTTVTDNEWKEVYDRAWRNHGNDCVEESDLRLFLDSLSLPGSVLEVGCGAGGLVIGLAKAGYDVTGMDVSEEALAIARSAAEEAGVSVRWHVGFAEHLPFADKEFDYIVSAHTLEHVRDLERTGAEFRRVARRKIVVLTPRQSFKRYMDNYHTQFFETSEDLASVFALKSFDCREIDASDHKNEFQGKALFYVGSL
ncbi:MAG TPA: methyltransferase domain-containing protein [Bacteroidota bacterium]